jgi:hypothetical protein
LPAPLPGLEPDEHLIARAPASFRGAAAASVRSTLALSAGRRRLDAYHGWQAVAAIAGFNTVGPEFVVGLTDRELILWSTSFWFSRPLAITGRVALSDIHEIAVARHGLVTGVAFALRNGAIVEVEAIRGRRLRHLAALVRDRPAGNAAGDSVRP